MARKQVLSLHVSVEIDQHCPEDAGVAIEVSSGLMPTVGTIRRYLPIPLSEVTNQELITKRLNNGIAEAVGAIETAVKAERERESLLSERAKAEIKRKLAELRKDYVAH